MLESIHRLNPHAFSNKNINKLKIGTVLEIPFSLQVISSQEKKLTKPVSSTSSSKNINTFVSSEPKAVMNENTDEFLPNTYIVKKGETLAQVVKNVRQKNISYTKMMKAVYTANPDAFLKSNITILKEGSVLRIPSIDEINKTTKVASPNKSNQNNLVINLEKRLRVLRRDLVKAQINLKTLNTQLNDKNNLINKQNTELETLFNAVNKNNGKDFIDEVKSYSKKSNDEPSSTQDASKNVNDSQLLLTSRNSYLPKDVMTQVKQAMQSSFGFLSSKDLIYSVIALFLGLLLIKYRRKLYSYVAISYDHPKYYPSDNKQKMKSLSEHDTEALEKEILKFHETLVNIDDDEVLEIGDDFIHECEHIVKDLSNNIEMDETIIEKLKKEVQQEALNSIDAIENDQKKQSEALLTEGATKFDEVSLDLFEGVDSEGLRLKSKSMMFDHRFDAKKSSSINWDNYLGLSTDLSTKPLGSELPNTESERLDSSRDETDTTPIEFRNGRFEEIQMVDIGKNLNLDDNDSISSTDEINEIKEIIDDFITYEEYCKNQAALKEGSQLIPA